MQIQVNTSNGIANTGGLEEFATQHLNDSLARFSADLTRVEVQLSDENSEKKGAADKRCMLEARMTGHEPVAVSHHAENQDLAFRGATQKLIHALDHKLGKMDRQDHRQRETIRRDTPVVEQ